MRDHLRYVVGGAALGALIGALVGLAAGRVRRGAPTGDGRVNALAATSLDSRRLARLALSVIGVVRQVVDL